MASISKDYLSQLIRQAGGSVIPDAYYIGTAKHESDFDPNNVTNEGNGTQSIGLYQVNVSEQLEAGVPGDLKDPFVNTLVFIYLAERNRNQIRQAGGIAPGSPDPWDMGPYLGIAHNQGLAAVLQTVRQYGINWPAYKTRNPDIAIVASGYGDDVIYQVQQFGNVAVGGKIGVSHAQVALLAGAGLLFAGTIHLLMSRT